MSPAATESAISRETIAELFFPIDSLSRRDWLINSGSSVYSVSRILGHNSTASVEKTYAHLLQESAEVDLEKCMKEAFEKR